LAAAVFLLIFGDWARADMPKMRAEPLALSMMVQPLREILLLIRCRFSKQDSAG